MLYLPKIVNESVTPNEFDTVACVSADSASGRGNFKKSLDPSRPDARCAVDIVVVVVADLEKQKARNLR